MKPKKRTHHTIDPKDIELNDWEFRLVMGCSWEDRGVFLNNIFCMCGAPDKKLIDFRIYLNDLNDLVLKGKCSGCNTLASRYIETGETPEKLEAAQRIRKAKN